MDYYKNILDLKRFLIPEFIFGEGAMNYTGNFAVNLGCKNILVVSDEGVIKTGITERVVNSLKERNLKYNMFSKITPNPRYHEVMEGADFYKKNGCDSIVAVGGGSVIDCAKGIGIVATNNMNILDFEGVDKVPRAMPPLICIPTTAGTSADVSQFAIINDTKRKVKIAIVSKGVVPDLSLLDPKPLTSMPAFLTACTGIDALVHAFEAFVSNAASHITDIHAFEAIKLIVNNLIDTIKYPDDLEKRAFVMMGSLEAGMAFSNASLGCVHAMAHSLGGYLDLPHGECNAMLLEHVVYYNFEAAEEKYTLIGDLLGLNLSDKSATMSYKKDALFNYIREFRKKAGVSGTLSESGVKEEDINILAAKAIKDPCNVTNPKKPTEFDLASIYREAM